VSEALPHPRETFDYLSDGAAEARFQEALARGRLHHAWLLTGPEGIGKATFAYRAARRLLGAQAAPSFGLLGAGPEDPVSRQIVARAHPDLLVLQRDPETGKTRRDIPVDEARALPEFFAKSPAAAPYRVAIVDTADDLNNAGANALLKTLEEPSERGVLFLISHAPGALLPTLRSRCRRLRFAPPAHDAASAWVAAKSGLPLADAERLVGMAQGAPGQAWRLAGQGALAMDETAAALLGGLPKVDDANLLALAESFRGAAGAERFNLLFDRLAGRVHARALEGGASGARLAEVWSDLVDLPRRAEAINLDRGDILYSVIGQLKAAV